ncbi:MAG TPA: pilus modification protein PilQ, partial [Pseudomonas sp.]|nr:pilus modification protein PilQ [Pseudomonas sp.]
MKWLAMMMVAMLILVQPGLAASYKGEPVSLNFQDVEVRSVLQVLADYAGINLVASDQVQGNITLRL